VKRAFLKVTGCGRPPEWVPRRTWEQLMLGYLRLRTDSHNSSSHAHSPSYLPLISTLFRSLAGGTGHCELSPRHISPLFSFVL
jgi:hypothetical protein